MSLVSVMIALGLLTILNLGVMDAMSRMNAIHNAMEASEEVDQTKEDTQDHLATPTKCTKALGGQAVSEDLVVRSSYKAGQRILWSGKRFNFWVVKRVELKNIQTTDDPELKKADLVIQKFRKAHKRAFVKTKKIRSIFFKSKMENGQEVITECFANRDTQQAKSVCESLGAEWDKNGKAGKRCNIRKLVRAMMQEQGDRAPARN